MNDFKALSQVVEAAQTKRRNSVFPDLPEGYTFKADGRCGFIYYREGDYILEIYWEMSGVPQYDILISPLEISTWTHPKDEVIFPEKQKEIADALKTFLLAKGIQADF